MDAVEEHIENEAEWTVRDSDGVDHRAVRQYNGDITWVVTVCPWWLTHNVAGQKALVRIDRVPNCIECVMIEINRLGKPHCKHCGCVAEEHMGSMTHRFEAA